MHPRTAHQAECLLALQKALHCVMRGRSSPSLNSISRGQNIMKETSSLR